MPYRIYTKVVSSEDNDEFERLYRKLVYFAMLGVLTSLLLILIFQTASEIPLILLVMSILPLLLATISIRLKHYRNNCLEPKFSKNRAIFLRRLNRIIVQLKCLKAPYTTSIIVVDIDHLRTINDAYGRDVGDRIIDKVEENLRTFTKCSDLLVKIDSDEFALAKCGSHTPEELQQYLRSLQNVVSSTYVVNEALIPVSVCIGVSTYPTDSLELETLFKNAELAVSAAKNLGRGSSTLFTSSIREMLLADYSLEFEIREAVSKKQLRLVYQPKFNAQLQIIGAEALLRWNHPLRGNIPPNIFISTAEKKGFIQEIDLYSLRLTCEYLKRLDALGSTIPSLSVNISNQSIQSPGFIEAVIDVIKASKCNSKRLLLEITESASIVDFDRIKEFVSELLTHSIHCSLDDFGTGYASMSVFKNLPIMELKIDREFITDITHNRSSRALVEMAYPLTSDLGINLVVEGVETLEQFEHLKTFGSDLHFQGFYLSKPLEEPVFSKLTITPTVSLEILQTLQPAISNEPTLILNAS